MMLKRESIVAVTLWLALYALFLPGNSLAANPNKHVISVPAGFFASVFGTINHILWCKRNGKIPVIFWDHRSLYFVPEGYNNCFNAWEYYFHRISGLSYEPGDYVHETFLAPDQSSAPFADRKQMSEIFKKYISVKRAIREKIYAFYKAHFKGKKTIGIHLRGTDKITEQPQVPLHVLINAANQYKGYQFFVATDDQALLEQAKAMLKGRVINYSSCLSTDGLAIHDWGSKYNKAVLGEEVLIDAILLSRCHALIHTNSSVSSAALYFNPNLISIFFDNMLYNK